MSVDCKTLKVEALKWKRAFMGLREMLFGGGLIIMNAAMLCVDRNSVWTKLVLTLLAIVLLVPLSLSGKILRRYYEEKTGYAEPKLYPLLMTNKLGFVLSLVAIAVGVAICGPIAGRSVWSWSMVIAVLSSVTLVWVMRRGIIEGDKARMVCSLLWAAFAAAAYFHPGLISAYGIGWMGIYYLALGIAHHREYLKLYAAGERVGGAVGDVE